MKEIIENLFVGTEQDCFYDYRLDWAVVHACKHPCHVNKVGYRGSLPPNHPEYLISECPGHLFLNIVDMQQPFMPRFAHPIIKKAMGFIRDNISSKKVLIHCNLGESRAPSIALIYLAQQDKIQNATHQVAHTDFSKLYPGYIPGRGILVYMQQNWQNILKL